ncbi:hypothetical protein MX633_11165 [Carnobacterium divergens]|uniref:hypothetical protein n=1 Tax=Carnobacterium divergens TaxID=2748 RepID=UPI00288C7208|nr:hypothetical protein [Carnobacterium divergens]MDT1997225.1 hypothetical protein [Carnobacterium divergens]
MNFIEVIEIDEEGNVKEAKVVNKETFEESEYTKFQWEGLFLKPKWSFRLNKWIETATDDELNPPVEEEELTSEEELAQQVSELEIKDMEKDILIEDLGQQLSDLEITVLGGNENE